MAPITGKNAQVWMVPTRDQTPSYVIVGHVGKTLVLRNRHSLDDLSEFLKTVSTNVEQVAEQYEQLAEVLELTNKVAIQHTREKE